MSLKITEYFYSIQGEGLRAGIPSVFIRLFGCNFRCKGFGVEYDVNGEIRTGCDSYFSVDPNFKNIHNNYEWRDIVNKVNDIIPVAESTEKVDIVITGGEPLIYWKNDDFQDLLAYYISRGHKITIETNGSIDIDFTRNYQKEISFSMSVKLENSGERKEIRINTENLIKIIENTKNSYFKFVVEKTNIDHTMKEIEEILNNLPYFAKVYLMPMGENKQELEENAEIVLNECIKRQFYYSDRLHIRVYDNLRGV